MSLEQALQENTIALIALTSALSGRSLPPTEARTPAEVAKGATALKAEPPKAEPPKAEPPKAEPPKAEPPKAEPPKAEPPKAEPPKAAPSEIRLETLVPQFQALITEKGRDKAVALLTKFGAIGLSKVPADKYAEFSTALAEARL